MRIALGLLQDVGQLTAVAFSNARIEEFKAFDEMLH